MPKWEDNPDRAHEPAISRWPRGWRLIFLIAAALMCWIGMIVFTWAVTHWLTR